jgi:hypothetical protein
MSSAYDYSDVLNIPSELLLLFPKASPAGNSF